ncbi:GTPase Era [Candidatus Bipolaricaulota bacterium]|nr:GTPase Era [Candidatus Bipolaricaulota bacterium]
MKSGFVHLLGKSNVGKSTFINRVVGDKVSITSDKPQTTRNRIKCIYNREDAQVVFLDTPGIHRPENPLGSHLVDEAKKGIKGSDIILYMVEPWEEVSEDEEPFLKKISSQDADLILLVNKVDIHPPEEIARTLEAYEKEGIFDEYVPISALTGDGIDIALDEVIDYLPEGKKLFPEDATTDKPLGFLMAEMVREKVYELTYEELPYSVATRTRDQEWRDDEDLVEVYMDIYVVRESQKGIIIGQGGKKIKEIGKRAREDLERLVGSKVYLDLKVKVAKNWNRNSDSVETLAGFDSD